MRRHLSFATILLSLWVLAPATCAEPLTGEGDESPRTLAELAREAGSRAALLASCGIGGGALRAGFEQRLETLGVSAADRSALGESYRSAESSAAATLLRSGAGGCADGYGLLRETLQDLARPVELSLPRPARPEPCAIG
jgi:hypothetical protein